MSKLFSLAGKTALVTGASSGIGYTVAKGLAAAGARVVVAARRVERLDDLVDAIAEAGGTAFAVSIDVKERTSVAEAFDAGERAFGIIDVIVSNAGVTDASNFLEAGEDARDAVLDTNFKGVWNVGQEGARRLVARQCSGSIINIASVLGFGVQPGLAGYCSSKGAVLQLTRSMAVDLIRHKIRVNALAPGWFKTELNSEFFDSQKGRKYIQRMPARRLGELEELIGPVLLLASDAGAFMNGSTLTVDGALGTMIL